MSMVLRNKELDIVLGWGGKVQAKGHDEEETELFEKIVKRRENLPGDRCKWCFKFIEGRARAYCPTCGKPRSQYLEEMKGGE